MKAASPTQEIPVAAPVVRILKSASCPSLSGKSTLTYHVGCTGDADVRLRVFANSGGGFFSNEWIGLTAIEQAFTKVPSGIAVTAHVLLPLFQGKSANSTGFMFAALKSIGMVRSVKDTKSYERSDAKGLLEEVKALLASGVNLKVEEKVAKVTQVKVTPEKSTPVKAVPRQADTKPVKTDSKVLPSAKPTTSRPERK
jgi:hypothetical protein